MSETRPTPADAARFSVAPMMDWTDRHCRYFHRLLGPSALLYTEMVTANAVIHGDRKRLLDFDPAEHPVALQLGGSEPEALAESARIGAEAGYDEINLNVGCPSDRVQRGRFGACLMTEPELVAECIGAMSGQVPVPVTVKTRIGVDEHDSTRFLLDFVAALAGAGVGRVIIHARKAWLSGLSPKENREVPPLVYDRVYRVKSEFPDLQVHLNGGVESAGQAGELMAEGLDGVMVGRAAYKRPWMLTDMERALGSGTPPDSRRQVVAIMADYAAGCMERGIPLKRVARHMLGLFQGQPGARAWRQHLSQNMHRPGVGPELLLEACPEP